MEKWSKNAAVQGSNYGLSKGTDSGRWMKQHGKRRPSRSGHSIKLQLCRANGKKMKLKKGAKKKLRGGRELAETGAHRKNQIHLMFVL